MASFARTVASLQSRLSLDVHRESPTSNHTDTSLNPSQRRSSEFPVSTSFSEYSTMSIGGEVGGTFEDHVDQYGSVSRRCPPGWSGFADDAGQQRSTTTSVQSRPNLTNPRQLDHSISLPLPRDHGLRGSFARGSEHACSAPRAIPTGHSEMLSSGSVSTDIEEYDGSTNLSAPLPQQSRSFYDIMTSPSKNQRKAPKDMALDYFEFADVMRSF